ncbi:nucleotide disphospho-sugar-binding domain-containing protein, partial [Nocardia gipuzkoensis]
EFARFWEPDLVIREAFTWAGGVVAEAVGAAHARMLHGPDTITRSRHAFLRRLAEQPEPDRIDPTAEWLEQELARFGRRFDEVVMDGHFTISQAPRSTRLDLGLRTVGIRYVPFNGRSVVPDWLREPPARQRICVTSGVAARGSGRTSFSQGELLAALGDLDAEIVTTMTEQERAQLDSVPGNVRVVDFVP